MNSCFVITGLIQKEYVDFLISSYKNIKHKIISTWYDQDENLINNLRINGFIIVQDNYPNNKNSTNYQLKTIYNGCLKAKELGYTHIVRMRTDILSFNTEAFLNLLETEFFIEDKLVSFCGIKTCDGIYFYDVMVAGKIEQMLEFFKHDQSMEDNRYTENFLLESSLNKSDITHDDVRKIFNFCYLRCRDENIDFFMNKYNHLIINDYCYCSFIWN